MVNYILKYFKYEWNMKDQNKYDPAFLYLKHLQTINSSLLIITEQLSNTKKYFVNDWTESVSFVR